MRNIIVLILALIPILASAQVKFEESSIKDALSKAKKENKWVVLDIISNKVDQESMDKLFEDKKTTDLMFDKFIPARMSMMKEENNEEFNTYIRTLSYPVAVFMNEKGVILGSIHWDAAALGYENFAEIVNAAIKDGEIKSSSKKTINFLDIDYIQALELSKKTGKPIFIDCFFIGCGPCKKMEDNIFTLDRVADFYNENFICIKLDRAIDPHGLIDKYSVTGYPTHLFLNSNGDVLVNENGGLEAEPFIELGKKALSTTVGATNTSDMSTGSITSTSSQESTEQAASFGSSMSSSMSSSGSSSVASVSSENSMSSISTSNTGVQFHKLSLKEAIIKAKAENKSIYVDLSATWCRPCKIMKQKVFPNIDVADYLNTNYVSIYFDCDVDGSLSDEYINKYSSGAFPTHLLIDSDGDLIHKFVGYQDVEPFLAELRKGKSDGTGLSSYNKRYDAGERSNEFMMDYITMLAAANEGQKASSLAGDFFKTLPIESLTNPKTFFLVSEFILDLDSDLAKKIIYNQELFEEKVGKEQFDQYINKLWIIKGVSYVTKKGDKKVFDKKGFDSFLKKLSKSEVDKNEYIKYTTTMENFYEVADWKGYAESAISYMTKYKGDSNPMLTWNWGARFEGECSDKDLRAKFAKYLSDNFELVKKSNNADAMVWMESINHLLNQLNK